MDFSKIGSLAELAKLLDRGEGQSAGGLAEQMLLMSFKDNMDTNAILRRLALDKLTVPAPAGGHR